MPPYGVMVRNASDVDRAAEVISTVRLVSACLATALVPDPDRTSQRLLVAADRFPHAAAPDLGPDALHLFRRSELRRTQRTGYRRARMSPRRTARLESEILSCLGACLLVFL